MRGEPLYKLNTERKTIILFPVNTLIAMGMGGFLVHNAVSKSPVDVFTLVFGVLSASGALLFVWALLKLNNYLIYADRVEVFSVFGTHRYTVLLSNIESWTEEERKNEGKKWMVLTAYSEAGNINISNTRPGYEAIKALLTTGKPNAKPQAKSGLQISQASMGYPLMALGVVLLIIAVVTFRFCIKPVLPANLTAITYPITTKPTWAGGGENRSELSLKVDKYPDFYFSVPSEAQPDSAWLFMDSVRKNDMVTIEIPTDDYEKKLSKTRPITFLDMNMNYHHIPVLGLTLKGRNYASLNAYNHTIFKGNLLVVPIFGGLLGLLALLQGFIYKRKAKR
jgi:hypothetical protein